MTFLLKNILLLFIAWIMSFSFGFSQQNGTFNRDSVKTITLVEFDKLVNRSIELLEAKELKDISDDQHVDIIMCLNTIFMARDTKLKLRFTSGNYEKLEKVADEVHYDSDIITVYPNWIPNRGMGFYFPDLEMELYGTPRQYAWYQVKN